MKLPREEVRTKEVLDWKGVHLLHASLSSCSQKVRILLGEKGVPFNSREIDLRNGEHMGSWFLGINPRGVVPVLVHDGDVHIESNDILRHIDRAYPTSEHSWMPEGEEQLAMQDKLLTLENDLHMDLRVVTMGYLVPQALIKRGEKQLQDYEKNGADDAHRTREVAWWRAFAEHGITEKQSGDAVIAFHNAFIKLEELLGSREWLLGDHPTVLDIAWFISLYRLSTAGYPIDVHPGLARLYARMHARPSFRKELDAGPPIAKFIMPTYSAYRRFKGDTLKEVYARVM